MATMSIFSIVRSLQGLADPPLHGGGFQHFQHRNSSHGRRSWQLSDAPRKTYGVTAFSLGCDKPKLRSSNIEYDQCRRERIKKLELGQRYFNDLRGLKYCSMSCNGLPLKASNSETTSTATVADTVQEQEQNGKSESMAEDVAPGAGTSSGLSALDAYFRKLRGTTTEMSGTAASGSTSTSVPAVTLPLSKQPASAVDTSSGHNSSSAAIIAGGEDLQGIKSLDAYFEKLNPKKKPEPSRVEEVELAENMPAELTDKEILMKSLMEAKEDYERDRSSRKDQVSNSETPGDLKFEVTTKADMNFSEWELPEDDTGNSNLINVLVAINFAVYLFGLASPHEALGITDSSLPIVYGAKVNDLITSGQWWRFITPMFLHASLLHVGLGSWALLSFGPAVESAYGTLGFLMIYFLGGLFGDLTSFFHTTEWTVGGTGPIYALVGTWVVYLLKNREIIGKDIADDMIRKVVILSAINVALCNSLPIDDWTHLGALLIGTLFGILAGPTMQLNVTVKDVSPDSEDEKAQAYLFFNDAASPLRLSLVFALCIGMFFILYQLSISGSNDFGLLQDIDDFA